MNRQAGLRASCLIFLLICGLVCSRSISGQSKGDRDDRSGDGRSGDGRSGDGRSDDRDDRSDDRPFDLRNSNLLSTTIQLPTLGVSIDANGVLNAKVFVDPKGELIRKRIMEANARFKGNLKNKVPLRKISLRRLEQEIKKLADQGKPPTDEMLHLAGLIRAEYVFVYPEQNDIVIAGPAEPWLENAAGRVVGIQSGKPTLLLDDLVAAMRTFGPNRRLNTWVACSIDPTPKGIERLKEFQKTIPKNIPNQARARAAVELATGLQKSLGNAEIKVYGVPRDTHLAQVMIEADYRMKMMAVGLEAPPIKMTTFIAALKGAPRDMQRWWFMPNYQCVKVDPDQEAMQLVGDGVVLSTQKIDFDEKARIVATGQKSSVPAKKYAASFTKKYAEISKVRPVYAQLRNVIDLLVICAWIKKNNAFEKAKWTPSSLLDEDVYSIQRYPNPKQCPCVANAVWKRHVLVLPAGGGVSIAAANALRDKNILLDKKGEIKKAKENVRPENAEKNWWWD